MRAPIDRWDSASDGMDEPLRIAIELHPGTEPVAGTITVAGAEPRAFVGWMELVHAIDLARHAHAPDRET